MDICLYFATNVSRFFDSDDDGGGGVDDDKYDVGDVDDEDDAIILLAIQVLITNIVMWEETIIVENYIHMKISSAKVISI